jgi:hypothetical protein
LAANLRRSRIGADVEMGGFPIAAIIPFMKYVRIDAKVEEAEERDVQQGGGPVAEATEAPRRRPERWIQKYGTAQAAESAGEFDVFH